MISCSDPVRPGNVAHASERVQMIANHLQAMLYRLGDEQPKHVASGTIHGDLDQLEALMHKLVRHV